MSLLTRFSGAVPYDYSPAADPSYYYQAQAVYAGASGYFAGVDAGSGTPYSYGTTPPAQPYPVGYYGQPSVPLSQYSYGDFAMSRGYNAY